MAQEHAPAPAKAPWTKIFTAFKVALDIKKLLLAAAGILLMASGWCLLAWTFHGIRGAAPQWITVAPRKDDPTADPKAIWNDFKARRASWNLLHELAGDPELNVHEDAADVVNTLEEFVLIDKWHQHVQSKGKLQEPIGVKGDTLEIPGLALKFKLKPFENTGNFPANATVGSISLDGKEADTITIGAFKATIVAGPNPFSALKDLREGTAELTAEELARANSPDFRTFIIRLDEKRVKPAGRLSTMPWKEDRGENPYLMVTDNLNRGAIDPNAPRMDLVSWLWKEQIPVLLEPIFKFLAPVKYLFDPRARGMDYLYLILVLLWTLTVWGFFGGAICRIAAVQVARNERITLKEALVFARERFLSYIIAPIFPLALVAILIIVLMIFGWLIWIPWLGELIAGLLWIIVLIVGFIIAVVLVGLVGWPLMNATISVEGSDSFDALSRSYSYVYQAPWQYLWYNLLAVAYGAVLVFFVGFMASLLVFTGKWGVGSAWGLSKSDPASDREPSYLFMYAPKSYYWRDLLISNNQHVKQIEARTPSGHKVIRREFTKEYQDTVKGANKFGAVLVTVWIYLLFLLVLGFGYSYFWSASTIIYFLMRHHVDDTDMDEVHLEDEGLDDPFAKPAAPPPAATPAPPAKAGTISLNVVDAPASPPPPPTAVKTQSCAA